MPSRLGILAIMLFWFVTLSFVGYRDVWPRYFGDQPPTVWIELSDEAATMPVRWSVYRGDTKIGKLNTQLHFERNSDAFYFASTYHQLQLDFGSIKATIPTLNQTIYMTRSGKLKAQQLHGKIEGSLLGVSLGEAKADVNAVVKDGQLVGDCKVESPLFGKFEQALTPVPVTDSQALNPLQPVNRLRGVRGGQRWVVNEVNPLNEALAALGQAAIKKGMGTSFKLGPNIKDRKPMIATVAAAPVNVRFADADVSCWLIECRNDHGAMSIWVAVNDGRVMKQTVKSQDETIRIEREE